MSDSGSLSDRVWQISHLMQGRVSAAEYGQVILPLILLRRLDCLLAQPGLDGSAVTQVRNRSSIDFKTLKADPKNIERNLHVYLRGFPEKIFHILDAFGFLDQIDRLRDTNILSLLISRFADVNLDPTYVSDYQMGLIFEELVKRSNEIAYEATGDYFTPRDVVRLMVHLLFAGDARIAVGQPVSRRLLDPACGSGGFLTEALSYVHDMPALGQLQVYGQDFNSYAFATSAAAMLIGGADHPDAGDSVRYGDVLTQDKFRHEVFHYFLCNPPFGLSWKKQEQAVRREYEERGFNGRFGAGLPRVSDGSLLFLQHMWSKRTDGSRLVVVFSGSPMSTGGAGSGESEIRRWIVESDWLEAVVALPESMFHHTGLSTYLWVLTNCKEPRRSGKVQLIDAREVWAPGADAATRRNVGKKRRHLGQAQVEEIARLYQSFKPGGRSKILKNADLGYTRVTIERPLRLRYQMTTDGKGRFLDAFPALLDDIQLIDDSLGREPLFDWAEVWRQADAVLASVGKRWGVREQRIFQSVFTQVDKDARPVEHDRHNQRFEPDPELREYENVPLDADADEYFDREIKRYVPDAWLDSEKSRVGYEINFNRYFYQAPAPPRPIEEIDADLRKAGEKILRLLREATS